MPTEADIAKNEDTHAAPSANSTPPQINEDAVIGMALAKQYMKAAKHGKVISGAVSNVTSKAVKKLDERHPNARHNAYEAVTSIPTLGLDAIGYTYKGAVASFNFTCQKAIPAVVKNTAKYGVLYPTKYGIVLPAVLFDETFPKTSNVIKKTPVTAFNVATSGTARAFDTVVATPYLFVKDDVITPALDRTLVQPAKSFAENNPKVFAAFKRDPAAEPGPLRQRLKTSSKAVWDVLPFEAPSEKYPKTYAAAQKGAQGIKKAAAPVIGAIGASGKLLVKEAAIPAVKFTGKNILAPSIKFAANDVISPAIDNTIVKPAKAFDRTFPGISSRLQAGFHEIKSRSGKISTNALAGTVAGGILTVRAAFGIFDLALDWAWKKPSKAFSKWKPETAQATENVYNAYQGVFKKIPYPATALLIPALGIPALYTTYWGTMGTKALAAAQYAGESVALAGPKLAAYTFGPKLAKVALFKPVISMGKTTKEGFFNSNLYNQHLQVGYEKYIDPGIKKSKQMVQDVDDWIEETIPSYKQIKVMLQPDDEGIKERAKKWANDVKPSIQGAFAHASETLRVREKPAISVETKQNEVTVETKPSTLDDSSAQKDWKDAATSTASEEPQLSSVKDSKPEEETPQINSNVLPT